MTMMTVNTTAGMRDLIALAREIETTEQMPRRLDLRLALHTLEDLLIDVAADVRYLPAGWSLQPHVSFSVPPEMTAQQIRDDEREIQQQQALVDRDRERRGYYPPRPDAWCLPL